MLIGRYDGKIGAKFQIALPKRFREILGERLVITKGLDGCLIVVSEANWKTLLEGTQGIAFTNKSAREMQRFLLGNAHYIELDSKGRCVVPEYLRIYAKIEDEIVYTGVERFVEIWNRESWENEQQKLSQNIESIAQKLTRDTAQKEGV